MKTKNDKLMYQLNRMEKKDKAMKQALNKALVLQTANGAPPPVNIPFQDFNDSESEEERDDISLSDGEGDDVDRDP